MIKVYKICLFLGLALFFPLAVKVAAPGGRDLKKELQEAEKQRRLRRIQPGAQAGEEELKEGERVAAPDMPAQTEEETKETETEFERMRDRMERERKIEEFNREAARQRAEEKARIKEEKELREAIDASVAEATQPRQSEAAAAQEEAEEPVYKKPHKKKPSDVGPKLEPFLPEELASIVEEYAESTFLDPRTPIKSILLSISDLDAGGFSASVHSAAISTDGKLVILGWGSAGARIWGAQTGKELHVLGRSLWSKFPVSADSVAISADGEFIVTGSSWNHEVRIWDVRTGKQLRVLEGHTAGVVSVAISADSRLIVTGSNDNTARIWDARTGRQQRVLEGHTGGVISVAINADGRFIVTGSRDGIIRIWDVGTGEEVRVLEGHTGMITSVAISVDGRLIVTGSWDDTARIWDAETGQTLHVLTGHTAVVHSVAISADGRFIVTGSGDNTARIWVVDSREHMLDRAQKMRAAAEGMTYFPRSSLDAINKGIKYLESAAGMAAPPREFERSYQQIEDAFAVGRQAVVDRTVFESAAELGLGGML